MKTPSIQLLSALHGEPIIYPSSTPITNDIISFIYLNRCYTDTTWENEKLCELMERMKKWIISQGIELTIKHVGTIIRPWEVELFTDKVRTEAYTEFDALVMACERALTMPKEELFV